MITAVQLCLHGLGDYVLQSDWMAQTKTKSVWPCLAHVILYMLPFAVLTQSPLALIVIAGSHFIIDHWRLARYVAWAKNFLAPPWIVREDGSKVRNLSWAECSGTGYTPATPAWLATWLMIITDNLMHIMCNALAIHYL